MHGRKNIKKTYRNSCKFSYPNRLTYVTQLTRHSVTYEVKFMEDALQSERATHEQYVTGTQQECYEHKVNSCTHKY